MTEFTGKIPRGIDLLKTLIELLADQEGVTIEYVIEEHGVVLEGITSQNRFNRKESK